LPLKGGLERRVQRLFDRFTTGCARFAGRPSMLLFCAVLGLAGVFAYLSGDARLITGATLLISALTLVLIPILQATQNRDGAALHAKLDELIRSHEAARDHLIGLERRGAEEIEELRPSAPEADDRAPGEVTGTRAGTPAA
jgi:low affinity Fe/Cu permease